MEWRRALGLLSPEPLALVDSLRAQYAFEYSRADIERQRWLLDATGNHFICTVRWPYASLARLTVHVTMCGAPAFTMTLSSPQLRRFVRRTLVEATGTKALDRPQLASAFNTLCERLRQRLQPLFGASAVTALFARALHVATAEFPWLADVIGKNGDGCSANVITSPEVEMASLEDGLAAVLAHNIGLLSTFVGDDLVLPLVQEAWGTAMLAEDRPGPKVINE